MTQTPLECKLAALDARAYDHEGAGKCGRRAEVLTTHNREQLRSPGLYLALDLCMYVYVHWNAYTLLGCTYFVFASSVSSKKLCNIIGIFFPQRLLVHLLYTISNWWISEQIHKLSIIYYSLTWLSSWRVLLLIWELVIISGMHRVHSSLY